MALEDWATVRDTEHTLASLLPTFAYFPIPNLETLEHYWILQSFM